MVDVIVVGGIGANAINKLNRIGTKVYRASKGTVRDNIELFGSNTMSEITVEHSCGSHAGECGHYQRLLPKVFYRVIRNPSWIVEYLHNEFRNKNDSTLYELIAQDTDFFENWI